MASTNNNAASTATPISTYIRFLKDDLSTLSRSLVFSERRHAAALEAHFNVHASISRLHGRLAALEYDYVTKSTPLGDKATGDVQNCLNHLARFRSIAYSVEQSMRKTGLTCQDLRFDIAEVEDEIERDDEHNASPEIAKRYSNYLSVTALVARMRRVAPAAT